MTRGWAAGVTWEDFWRGCRGSVGVCLTLWLSGFFWPCACVVVCVAQCGVDAGGVLARSVLGVLGVLGVLEPAQSLLAHGTHWQKARAPLASLHPGWANHSAPPRLAG